MKILSILVPLNHWKQLTSKLTSSYAVVICFHFSTFESLETTGGGANPEPYRL